MPGPTGCWLSNCRWSASLAGSDGAALAVSATTFTTHDGARRAGADVCEHAGAGDRTLARPLRRSYR
jgi:hypothetical protein